MEKNLDWLIFGSSEQLMAGAQAELVQSDNVVPSSPLNCFIAFFFFFFF